MKKILNQLFEHQSLGKEEAREVLIRIAKDAYNPAQVAAFISVYLMRSVTVDELEGFRDALLELCVPVDLQGVPAIDLCGTGGDGKNTFNVSTLASIVTAGAGYKVSKHGNYGVSSVCGSSNVLESLGYRFTNDPDTLSRQLDRANITFLHAPLFHPAMKSVAPIRRQLGVKTFFNMLGPIVNPARPPYQLTGVFSLKLARLYHYLHQNTDKKYSILHSLDGYDEISLTGDFLRITPSGEEILSPGDIGLPQLKAEQLFGGDTIEEASAIFTKVLSGQGSDAQNAAVLANAGQAIQTFHPEKSFADCYHEAHESLLTGKAQQTFTQLLELQPSQA